MISRGSNRPERSPARPRLGVEEAVSASDTRAPTVIHRNEGKRALSRGSRVAAREEGGVGSCAARWAERKVEGGARRAMWAAGWGPGRLGLGRKWEGFPPYFLFSTFLFCFLKPF